MKILGVEFGKKEENNSSIMVKLDKEPDKFGESDKFGELDKKPKTDKPYSRYQNFVKQITNKEWHYVGDVQKSLNNLSSIVSTYYVGKNMYGTFLEVACPSPLYMITICGFNDAGINPIEFYSHSNLYKIPHFFSITCTDNSGKELSPDVPIDVAKAKLNGESKKLRSELYGDLSQHVDGRFRRKEERYYFDESIKLEDHERLSFRVNSPDIDITKTRLSMNADLFVKKIF